MTKFRFLILFSILGLVSCGDDYVAAKNEAENYILEHPFTKNSETENFITEIPYEEEYLYSIENFLIKKRNFERTSSFGVQHKKGMPSGDYNTEEGLIKKNNCDYFYLVISHNRTEYGETQKYIVLERNCFDGKISIVYKKTIGN